jgi:Ca2+-transporting ATPase
MTHPTVTAHPFEELLDRHWHHLAATEVASLLEIDPAHGLSEKEADERRERFGPNVLPAPRGKPAWRRLLLQFHAPLIYILLASSAITAALGEWVDSGVILAVVLVNAVVGYIQEQRATDALAALKRMLRTVARTRRDGQWRVLDAAELVPGDVVRLEAGDRVPADVRLLHARGLFADEAALTGESLPAEKHAAALPADTVLADRRNMAYAGTLMVRGQAEGVVVATAGATETGRIARMVREVTDLSTPFTRRVAAFSRVLLVAILIMAGLTFAVGVARGQPMIDMFMAAVALAVGAIPEGLPAAVTVVLAIGVKRMAARRAIVRTLPAVETLGSVTVICSDKTGTLTENQMTVREIYSGGERFDITGQGYDPTGEIRHGGEMAVIEGALRETLLAGRLCNDARLRQEDGLWKIDGDPTEGALLVAASKAGLGESHANEHARVDALPFDSEFQYMATAHRRGDVHTLYVKGAPERILERCVVALDAWGNETSIDPARIEREAEAMAARGLRVLALARKAHAAEDALGHHHVRGGLVFLGLAAMLDPPRAEARQAVARCRAAGIRVKMITGDHAVTAAAIARELGIAHDETALTGRELARMSDEELAEAAATHDVFARVEPEHKLRLVRALQARGEVVAMTGDGVNDAPALRAADIGVAMGRGGTETAREASAMVLTDDNFATIIAAAEEGRGVFDNLTKFIVWTLPTNFGEGLVITVAILLGVALPITPLQILWINLTTAVLLGTMLAFEPIEAGVMQRAPRRPDAPLLDAVLLRRVVLVGMLMVAGAFGLYAWKMAHGGTLAEARTLAVNVFVLAEMFYLFNCRSLTEPAWRLPVFSNPWVWLGAAFMLSLQLLFTYAPFMQRMFGTAPLTLADWLAAALAASLVPLLVIAEMTVTRRRLSRQTPAAPKIDLAPPGDSVARPRRGKL